MTQALRRVTVLLALAGAVFSMTACGQGSDFDRPDPSIFEPASDSAERVANLSLVIHFIMLIIFLGVTAVLLLAWWRFRERPESEARQFEEHRTLEIAWTVAPFLILAVVFVYTMIVMVDINADEDLDDPQSREALRVQVIGHLWWWEFRIPELGIVTANELHIPVGQRVEFELVAEEVLHSFWVPELSGKRDNMPGDANYLWFEAEETGTYAGVCAEFCGIQHAWMQLHLIVDTPEDFEAWVVDQQTPADEPTDELAVLGKEVFFSNTCVSCHAISGTEADAEAGPTLSNIADRDILAAGVLENTPENMARWIAEPQDIKPGNHMPDSRLTEEEILALTAYMYTLD